MLNYGLLMLILMYIKMINIIIRIFFVYDLIMLEN